MEMDTYFTQPNSTSVTETPTLPLLYFNSIVIHKLYAALFHLISLVYIYTAIHILSTISCVN